MTIGATYFSETVGDISRSADSLVDSEGVTSVTDTWIRRTDLNIFLLALLFAGADSFLMALEPIFASSNSMSSFVTSVVIIGGLSPLSLLSYLIHPSLFFIVVYFASMKLDLGKHYVAVSFSLFFGGISGVLVGSFVGLYAQLVAFSSTSTGATSQLVAGIGPIFAGLFAFFAGFSAASLAHLKAEGLKDERHNAAVPSYNPKL